MYRIYSNVSLPWAERQMIHYTAKKYTGYVMNFYLYRLTNDIPYSLAPLDVLQKNRVYRCYPLIGFSSMRLTNTKQSIQVGNSSLSIFLPSNAKEGDILAIHDPSYIHQREVFFPSIFF